MRIGMKISPLTVLRAGIPNYILNLLKSLGREDDVNSYFLYTNRPLDFDLDLPDRFRTVLVRYPSPRLQLWYQLGLPLRMMRDRIDLFHDPVFPLPLLLPVPGVITVHDLSGYTDPGLHNRRTALGARLLPLHVRRARMIMADSGYTASQLESHFPGCGNKTLVVPLGVSEAFRPVDDPALLDEVRSLYGLPMRFLLFLGTLEPRKNLPRLLDAFADCSSEVPHALVIAGGLGWKYSALMEAVSGHPAADRIILTGYVSDEHLPALLTMAEFLVYPSLLEGFGLPVLEAMACGTPVITSASSSLAELAGNAALLADPLSVDSISECIMRMASEKELRKELSERGIRRASGYNWERTARETLRVYHRVAD